MKILLLLAFLLFFSKVSCWGIFISNTFSELGDSEIEGKYTYYVEKALPFIPMAYGVVQVGKGIYKIYKE